MVLVQGEVKESELILFFIFILFPLINYVLLNDCFSMLYELRQLVTLLPVQLFICIYSTLAV